MMNANDLINNWTPEVASLITTLNRHGLVIVSGDNGEERFNLKPGRDGMKNFIANLIACDEARLYVKTPDREEAGVKIPGRTLALYLVLGNSPGEIVCDYSACEVLDKATEEHYNRWEGRKQPKMTRAAARLEYLRGELRAERISTGEILELQSLIPYIKADDVELLEAAGVDENTR